MKAKRLICFITALFMCFLMSGCSIFTVDTAELLSPPALSGNIAPIADAIKKSIKGDYVLQYPSKGNYRSAVVQNDINGDGKFEAFAFYSQTETDTTTMYINVICNNNGKWFSEAQQKLVAGGVDRIDFCDLDGDGILEILVGWEIYGTSEMQLAVYSFRDNTLIQRMLQSYTHFICCDLNEDSKNEILLINFNSAESVNTASLYELTDDGVSELDACELDPTVQSVNEPVISHLSSGRPAVYIDEIKGVGAVTEVVFIEKNKLVNPLYNVEKRENPATLRAASYNCQDINGDGIIEIPVQQNVPSLSKSAVNEKLYLTNWCSYNGETLTLQMTAIMNTADGYYYKLSPKWVGNIAVLKDTDNKIREIYSYDNTTLTSGNKLLYIQAVKKSDWEKGKYNELGFNEITHNIDNSFICWISDTAAKLGLTLDEVRNNFNLIE